MFVKLSLGGNPLLINSERVVSVQQHVRDSQILGSYIKTSDGNGFPVMEKFDKVAELLGWRKSGESY